MNETNTYTKSKEMRDDVIHNLYTDTHIQLPLLASVWKCTL